MPCYHVLDRKFCVQQKAFNGLYVQVVLEFAQNLGVYVRVVGLWSAEVVLVAVSDRLQVHFYRNWLEFQNVALTVLKLVVGYLIASFCVKDRF